MKNKLKQTLIGILLCLCAVCFISCSPNKKEHTVSFVIDGETVATQTIEDGKIATSPDTPEKEDHLFKGWYTDDTYETIYDFNTPITADTTIYAWLTELFDVNFIVDGETVSLQTIEDGKHATAPATPEKEGHAFIGWYTDDTYETAYDFNTPVTNNLNLYAYFRATHIVSFIVDGETYATQTVFEGENVLSIDDPKKEYAVFEKWCVDETRTFAFDFSTPIYEKTDIYALFSEAYKVTYMADESNVISTEFVKKETAPIRPANPEVDGYKIKGWYLDPEYTTEYGFDTAFEEDATLYAKYEKVIVIYTAASLKEIANKPDGFYRLGCDINLLGEAWTPIENFSGELEGDGYKIEYFTISATSSAGFIQTNDGVIRNITFEDMIVTVSCSNRTTLYAGVIASLNNGTIENCTVFNAVITYTVSTSTDTGSYYYYMGGVVGVNSGSITDCTAVCEINLNATVYGDYVAGYGVWSTKLYTYMHLGGMIGRNNASGSIKNSLVNAKISTWTKASGEASNSFNGYAYNYMAIAGFASVNEGLIEDCGTIQSITSTNTVGKNGTIKHWLGGFVQSNSGEINSSFAKGTINEQTAYAAIGGFAETNSALIKDCYTDCEINSTSMNANIGGFVVTCNKTISSSYAIAKITAAKANRIGGFVSTNAKDSTINACFSSTEIAYETVTNVGAFAGVTESGAWYEKCYSNADCKILQGETEVEYTETNTNVSALDGETLYSETIVFESLWWNKGIWALDGENPPALQWVPAEEDLPKQPDENVVEE